MQRLFANLKNLRRFRSSSLTLLAYTLLLAASVPATVAASAQQLTPEQTQAIARYVNAEIARQRIPGVEVGIYRDGQAILAKGYGFANLEHQVPVKPETAMQSGSTGKQFVATAILGLVEQGKLSLEDPITKYFTDGPESWQAIKIKNLLSHTSGLAEYESDERTKADGPFYMRLDFTEDELLHKIEKLPIEFKPGDKWDYRNTNYVLLGILIHKLTGQFYGDYLHDKFFGPLGMTSTRIISEREIIPNRSAGYELEGGKIKNQEWVSPTFDSTADGALYFNVLDLEKWDRALYGNTLLTKASFDRMWTPFVLNDGKPNPAGYGFAWQMHDFNGHKLIEHTGAWQGFTCIISRYVDDKLTVAVLTNLDAGHSRPTNIERVVAGLVLPALMPKLNEPIADTKPEIAKRVHGLIEQTIAGKDLSSEYTADAHYKLDPNDAAETLASLPPDWSTLPIVLIRRKDDEGKTLSAFRIGNPGNTRVIQTRTDASGKFESLTIQPDPDNR
jgi:CubicO group peptidase (beta-lactamase class C family)